MWRTALLGSPSTWLIILVEVPLGYFALIVVLRLGGKRAVAKMNAFDLIVTVSIGSLLASAVLPKTVALLDGVLAFALLVILQAAIARSLRHWRWLNGLITGTPRALLIDGALLPNAFARERVGGDEVRAAVRNAGIGDLAMVAAVVLESDGSLSVIAADKAGVRSALAGVVGTGVPRD